MFYFDNAATTYPKPDIVYKTIDEFYRQQGVNVARGQYKEASKTANIVRETRDLLLQLYHCNSSKDVVFTPSSTIALNMIIQGQDYQDGDIVYISKFEHNAVLRTLYHIQKKVDIVIKFIEPEIEDFEYDFEQINTQFSMYKPKLLICNHASNSFGFINPVEKICKIAHKYSCKTIIDASQTAGLLDISLNDIDYLIFAGHKTLYAPFGIAGFVVNKNDNLKPIFFGGTGIDSANKEMPNEIPTRLEPGSPNVLAIAGLNASLKWILKTSVGKIKEKEDNNFNKLLEILSKYSNIKTFVKKNKQVGIISSVFDGYASDNIGQVLSNFDIAVRTGLHCAPISHEYMGTAPAGTVRFSINYFTSDTDFEALDNALKYIQENS